MTHTYNTATQTKHKRERESGRQRGREPIHSWEKHEGWGGVGLTIRQTVGMVQVVFSHFHRKALRFELKND